MPVLICGYSNASSASSEAAEKERQKSHNQVEVRQTDNHGTITARDNYELTRNQEVLKALATMELLQERVSIFQVQSA